jgi:predicted ATPase
MPSKLKSIEVDNWKSLRSLRLDFDDINVLVGPNGSGKSNLVQFFHMMNMMMSGNLQLYVGRAGGANSLLHYGSKNAIFIDSKLTFSTDTGRDDYAFRLIHGAPDTFVFASENVTFQASNHTGKPFFVEFGAGHKESLLEEKHATASPTTRPTFGVVRAMLTGVRYFRFHDTSMEAHIRGTRRKQPLSVSQRRKCRGSAIAVEARVPRHFLRSRRAGASRCTCISGFCS